jgi:WD40 repeat protein/DNA-binding winged helix-turn-helix (wHTH) protein
VNQGLKNGNKSIYSFADFELDLGKGVLLRDGEPISLQWKSLEVLCELISSGGDLITREELIERVWPDSFVEENNLSQHIRALRKALGDGENGNRFIETVPRKGFRFLPPVEEVPSFRRPENALTVHETIPQPPLSDDLLSTKRVTLPRLGRRTAIALFGLAVTLAAVFVFWNNQESSAEKRLKYAIQIRLAAQALETSNLPLTQELLEGAKPGFFESDLRGFEWAYLSQKHQEQLASQPIILQHGGVDSVAYSPDGRALATAGMDMVIRLWDIATGRQIRTFEGHTSWLVWVTFSPDGTLLATGAFDRSAKVWDVESGQLLSTIKGESSAIGWLAFLPDGKTLAGADGDKIRFWDVDSGHQTQMSKGAVEYLDSKPPLTFSVDGRLIAARTNDQSVVVWEIGGRRLSTFRPDVGGLFDMKFSPDSSMLIAGGDNGKTELWNLSTGKRLNEFSGHSAKIRDVAFSSNGRFIATGSEDNTVKLWDPKSGILLSKLSGHTGDVTALAISPDGMTISSGSGEDDGTVRIWKVPKSLGQGLLSGHATPITGVSFSRESKTLVSASKDGTAKLWDIESQKEILTLKGQTKSVNSPVFSSFGNLIAAGDDDNKIRLWEAGTGREVMTIEVPKPATNLTFSPNEKLLATGHWFHDRSVRLWNVQTGKLACSFDAHKAGPGRIEFSKDGENLLTSALDDSFVYLWETTSCRQIWSYQGDPGAALVAHIAPDGMLLALQVLNDVRSLKLIDLQARKGLAAFAGHEAELRGADFSPDGNRLFTSDESGLIKIWDATTGQELLTLKADIGQLESTALSPDGKVLAAAGSNGTIRLWRVAEYAK